MDNEKTELPLLFTEDVVWDSSRLRVVKLMSELECRAIVKSTSRNLRTNAVAIRHAFTSFTEIRTTNARFDAAEMLSTGIGLEGDEEEQTDDYGLRRRIVAEQSLAEIYALVGQFRRDAGYRMLCLLAMSAGEGHSAATVQAASGIRLLGRVQSEHLEALMLIEKIKGLHKFKAPGSEEEFGREQLIQSQLLDCHLAPIVQVFNKIDAPLGDKSLYDTYQFLVETHTEWSDSKLSELRSAESAVRVFREANTAFTRQITDVVNSYTHGQFSEGCVFPKAA